MAQPSISDTFITKLQELARQNASVDEVLQQNNLFNNMVKTDLNEINQKILRITEEIKKLQTRLAETLNKVASNEDDIKANITASEDLARQLSDITAEREQASTALAANQQEIDALRAAAAETDTQYRADLARLEAEKEAERVAMQDATSQQKEILKMQLQDTDSKIANLKKSHEKESSELRFQLAQLNARTSQLEEYLTESNSKFTAATAKVEELNARNRELIIENENLNEILEKAIPIIEAAKNKLNALSDNKDQNEINRLIALINTNLSEINGLLGINSTSIPSAASDQFSVVNPMGVRVSRPPGSLIKPNIANSVVRKPNLLEENFTINGKNYTLQEIIGTLKTNPELIKENPSLKPYLEQFYSDIYDPESSTLTTGKLINKLKDPNNTIDSVKDMINDLIDPLKFEEEYNSLEGGKRIRKTRKTKKIRRKTRRRKTKKVQRGGYHYNERAKRRSITTTSSKRTSKRSSKRNKRTSSI